MKKIMTVLGGLVVGLFLTQTAMSAARVDLLGDGQVLVNSSLQIKKPSNFTTEKAKNNPVDVAIQFFNREPGYDPHIVLKTQNWRTGLAGKNSLEYAAHVKKQYQTNGVAISRMETQLINGRRVAILHGTQLGYDKMFMVAVWRTKGTGYILECSSLSKDFAEFTPEFRKTIETARFYR